MKLKIFLINLLFFMSYILFPTPIHALTFEYTGNDFIEIGNGFNINQLIGTISPLESNCISIKSISINRNEFSGKYLLTREEITKFFDMQFNAAYKVPFVANASVSSKVTRETQNSYNKVYFVASKKFIKEKKELDLSKLNVSGVNNLAWFISSIEYGATYNIVISIEFYSQSEKISVATDIGGSAGNAMTTSGDIRTSINNIASRAKSGYNLSINIEGTGFICPGIKDSSWPSFSENNCSLERIMQIVSIIDTSFTGHIEKNGIMTPLTFNAIPVQYIGIDSTPSFNTMLTALNRLTDLYEEYTLLKKKIDAMRNNTPNDISSYLCIPNKKYDYEKYITIILLNQTEIERKIKTLTDLIKKCDLDHFNAAKFTHIPAGEVSAEWILPIEVPKRIYIPEITSMWPFTNLTRGDDDIAGNSNPRIGLSANINIDNNRNLVCLALDGNITENEIFNPSTNYNKKVDEIVFDSSRISSQIKIKNITPTNDRINIYCADKHNFEDYYNAEANGNILIKEIKFIANYCAGNESGHIGFKSIKFKPVNIEFELR